MRTLLLALLIGITTAAYGQINCEEDRFKEITECKTSITYLSIKDADISTANTISVNIGKNYALYFTFASDSWKFLKEDKIYFLLDNQPKQFDLQRMDTQVESGYVIEQYAIILNEEQVSDFVNAQTIEFKISNSEFVYPKEAHRQLVELVNHN